MTGCLKDGTKRELNDMGRQGGVVEELPESIAGLPIADWEDVLHRTLMKLAGGIGLEGTGTTLKREIQVISDHGKNKRSIY